MKHNEAKSFVLKTIAIVILSMCLYLTAFWVSLGRYTPSAWWVKDTYQYKETLAKNITYPKILVIGGSNSLFSINGGVLEQITGYPVVNFATHGALHLDFHYYKVLDHLGEGDVVILPMEFSSYGRPIYNDWFVNNMMSWGWDDYLSRLSVYELLKFISHTTKGRIWSGIMGRKDNIPLMSKEDVLTALQKRVDQDSEASWNNYSALSLDRWGGINIDEKTTEGLKTKMVNGHDYEHDDNVEFNISELVLSNLERLQSLVDKKNGHLIITWPVSIRNKSFDLQTPRDAIKVKGFANRLNQYGFIIHCAPKDAQLELDRFYDTPHHTNRTGALERSMKLGDCVSNHLNLVTH